MIHSKRSVFVLDKTAFLLKEKVCGLGVLLDLPTISPGCPGCICGPAILSLYQLHTMVVAMGSGGMPEVSKNGLSLHMGLLGPESSNLLQGGPNLSCPL